MTDNLNAHTLADDSPRTISSEIAAASEMTITAPDRVITSDMINRAANEISVLINGKHGIEWTYITAVAERALRAALFKDSNEDPKQPNLL